MIWFTGDINYCDGYFDVGIGTASLIREGLDPLRYLPMDEKDIWIGNFEGVCSNVSELDGIAARQFIVDPKTIIGFKHPNIYAVANNHVMQHGSAAYNEMLKHIETLGSEYVGTAKKRTILFSHQDKQVALTAFSQRPENFKFGTLYWSNPEYSEIELEFNNNIKHADFKIAYIHWGNEFMNYPYLDQQNFAHFLIDIGFDLIIGMHPHILQGFEIYKNKYIFYSLGNTVFNMAWYKTKYGALIKLDLSKEYPKIDYVYTKIDKNYCPHIVAASEVPEDCRFVYLNSLIKHNKENEKYYNELSKKMNSYRRANYINIFKSVFKMNPKYTSSIIIDFIKRKLKI